MIEVLNITKFRINFIYRLKDEYMDLQQKIEKVKEYFKDKEVLIAFSGGADSTLIAKIAKDNAKNALAVTIDIFQNILCILSFDIYSLFH